MFLIIYLGFGSRQNSIDLPTNYKRATFDAFWASVGLFGLSTPEVCRAFAVASKAVVSYTTFSPLPLVVAVCFLWHCLSALRLPSC